MQNTTKKYVLVDSGAEVNIGDVIASKYKKETSFGMLEVYKEITVTENNIPSLIKKGIIKEVTTTLAEDANTLFFFIKKVAELLDKTNEEVIDLFEKLNKVCPKAVLDILLQAISVKFFNDDPEGFSNAKEYYSLKAKDGTVGKVYSPSPTTPLFKSIEDAEKARKILKVQLEHMYGKGKQENP